MKFLLIIFILTALNLENLPDNVTITTCTASYYVTNL